jgi:dTDP-4-dehydrorhamnose 3,5-epimerase
VKIQGTRIPGCLELYPDILKDNRGIFVKTFQRDIFEEQGMPSQFAEEYYTYSHQGVVRGLHFQVPPMDHDKLVYCVSGTVFDAVVDLRVGSPSYGTHSIFDISAEKANMIYLPAGLAHGFLVLSASAVLMYKVTTAYSRDHDSGIMWNSAGIPWPTANPIISKRDSGFPTLAEFKSPFVYSRKP